MWFRQYLGIDCPYCVKPLEKIKRYRGERGYLFGSHLLKLPELKFLFILENLHIFISIVL